MPRLRAESGAGFCLIRNLECRRCWRPTQSMNTLHLAVSPTASRLLKFGGITRAGGELAALHLLGPAPAHCGIGGSQKDAVGGEGRHQLPLARNSARKSKPPHLSLCTSGLRAKAVDQQSCQVGNDQQLDQVCRRAGIC